jgi:patatin-like phospholipase/acyl hydrolase
MVSKGVELELRDVLRTVLEREEKPSLPTPFPARGEKVFVLTIDGGGTRGLIPCVILERIVKEFPDFLSHVNVVSGSSIGAMIAMSLAFNYTPRVIREVIELTACIPFAHVRWSNRCLSVLCHELLGQQFLKDASKKVVVSALKLDNKSLDDSQRSSEVRVFHNFTQEEDSNTELASDIVMRSSAAPSYFPSWQGYIDGGMFAPDPSSLCLSYVLAPNLLNVPMENVVLLSLSTGNYMQYFSQPTHNWGYLQWAPKIDWNDIQESTVLSAITRTTFSSN